MVALSNVPLLAWTCFTGLTLLADAVIPQNTPLTIEQSGWCFDHQWSSDPDQLILYDCSEGNNQQFTWRQENGWDFYHLISNQADKCIGFDSSDLEASGAPKNDAPVVFKDCEEQDDLAKWTYLYGTQQLQLTKFPTKCLDYSLTSKVFVAYDCKKDLGNFELRNQQMVFSKVGRNKIKDPIKEGMPVEIQQASDSILEWWGGDCLDQSQDPQTLDHLILFPCKRSANQLFHFTAPSEIQRHKDILQLNHLVSSKDGKCVAAGTGTTPQAGDPLVLKECSDEDMTIKWRYAHGLEMLKLEKWPTLCLGVIDESVRRMGVLKCQVDSRGWADAQQHFRVLDMGEKPIPEHAPLTIKQNGWCLDQKFSSSPDEVILYNCQGSTNQEWVWRGSVTLGYHYIVSNLDDRCLGVDQSSVDSSGKPTPGAKIAFTACKHTNDLIKWDYVYSSEQFKLTQFEDLCMEYSDASDTFVVHKCRFEEYRQFVGDDTYKQRFDVSRSTDSERLPVRLPVRIEVGRAFMGWQKCLDRPPHTDHLVKWDCKMKETGFSINQEFVWRGNASWHFSQLVSNVDLKCLAAASAEVGAAVSFQECRTQNPMMQWVYSHGKGFIKLSEHPDLCLGFNEGAHKVTLLKCSFDIQGLADDNQMMAVKDLGFSEIKEDNPEMVEQNGWCLDRPYAAPEAGKSELNLYVCGGGDNQKFVWYNLFTWKYHYLISHVDNLCVGVAGSSKPSPHSPIKFKPCSDDDPNIRWEYGYGLSQLKMSQWPDLCLDYDDGIKAFAVNPCTLLDGGNGLLLWPAHNQVFTLPGVLPKPKKKKHDSDAAVGIRATASEARRRKVGVHRRRFHSDPLKLYELQDEGAKDLPKQEPSLEVRKPPTAALGAAAVCMVSVILVAVVVQVRRLRGQANEYSQVDEVEMSAEEGTQQALLED